MPSQISITLALLTVQVLFGINYVVSKKVVTAFNDTHLGAKISEGKFHKD